ncbi:MAG: cation:proton antiporter [Candidatus Bathyarchaeota archaeon]|nr:cation:proton antiporter [Candidatus Bathyarchaeota archaeon]
MVDSVSVALIISALIVLIGFLGNYLFKKTGLPDMLILIFLGVLFGPILGIFSPTTVKDFAPYIAALALAFILFDGGMGLDIKRVLHNSPRAVTLAVLGFIFSLLGVCAFTVVVFGVPLVYGLLFGSIVGGSSSVVVISLASRIKISQKGAIILILESAITDILCIVITLSLIDVIVTGHADFGGIIGGIAAKFLIGILIGVAMGVAWLFALRKVAHMPFSYMLTLGMVLLGYAATESMGGSGALAALLFGLILGNERELFKVFRINEDRNEDEKVPFTVSKGLRRFQAEIAFLIRTFFFVFLGIIASISSISLLLAGITLSVILFVTRFGAVWVSTQKSALKGDQQIMTIVLTRGLAAAVLATLPAQYNLPYSDLFVDIAVVVIVSTAIMATVGTMLIGNKKPSAANEKNIDEQAKEKHKPGVTGSLLGGIKKLKPKRNNPKP